MSDGEFGVVMELEKGRSLEFVGEVNRPFTRQEGWLGNSGWEATVYFRQDGERKICWGVSRVDGEDWWGIDSENGCDADGSMTWLGSFRGFSSIGCKPRALRDDISAWLSLLLELWLEAGRPEAGEWELDGEYLEELLRRRAAEEAGQRRFWARSVSA